MTIINSGMATMALTIMANWHATMACNGMANSNDMAYGS